MKSIGIVLVGVMLLSACGGGGTKGPRGAGGGSAAIASGPISAACLKSNRKAASRQLCGCIQGVANATLSGADQRMAAGFFSDPHKAQVIRQSDRPAHEAFWQRYKAFTARAERTCSGY